MQSLPIIQSLWIGDKLSTMERLCISSFLYHGHSFHLYTYNHIENIPKGTIVRDANEIISSDIIFKDKYGSYATFSDIFRYKLLFEKGNYWVDTDMICLQPFTNDSEYIFASERVENPSVEHVIQIANCLIKAPLGSAIMKYCYSEAIGKEPNKIEWCEIGPRLVEKAVEKFTMKDYIADTKDFCPIDWWNWEQLIDGSANKNILYDAQGVHLWNEMWRRNNIHKNANFDEKSIYEVLKKQYSI